MRCLLFFELLIIASIISSCNFGNNESAPPSSLTPAIKAVVENAPPPVLLDPEGPPVEPKMENSSEFAWQFELHKNLIKNAGWGLNKKTPDLKGMIFVTAGNAMLGCTEDYGLNRHCQKEETVNVQAFYIDKYELTNEKYDLCVQEMKCLSLFPTPHIPDAEAPNRPAIITYGRALRYCLWAGKRLPTIIEWEKSARGTDGRKYPWGNQNPDPGSVNICGNRCTMKWRQAKWTDGHMYTSPVGSFSLDKSPFGLMDVSGNVKEWVTTIDALPEHVHLAAGGSWYEDLINLQPSVHQYWRPGTRLDDKGVRCVADAK